MMAGADTPESVAAGLDLFAAAWAEEWTRFGGFVTMNGAGDCNVGYPMRPVGPGYEAHLGAEHQPRREFDDAHYQGRMRGLLALLETVPQGREALAAHMAAHAIGCYHAGRAGLMGKG